MCLRFADRPCFIAANPTIFSPKIKKRECCPTLLNRSWILELVFKFFADSIRYVVKPFMDTFRFCQSKMATFSSLFVSKNVITKIKKACLKHQVITRCLEIFNDNYLCDGVFLLLLLDVVNRGLELSEERKLNTFITDYIDSRFIIYKSARYVPFVQCRR